jgi:DNA-binding response OmpR family regulator
MKKVLIAQPLRALLDRERTFLDRADMLVFVASTNDEALAVHRADRVDLIMSTLDLPGMPTAELCSRIREDARLRPARIIITCADTPDAIKRCSKCSSDAVLLEPVPPVLLVAKAQQLLFIATRETLRVALDSAVDGHAGDGPFYCRTRNVSVSGMLIETDKRLAAGTRFSCRFYLPVAQSVEAVGRIVRIIEQTPATDAYQYGLMFTEIAPEARLLIAHYVDETSRAASLESS